MTRSIAFCLLGPQVILSFGVIGTDFRGQERGRMIHVTKKNI